MAKLISPSTSMAAAAAWIVALAGGPLQGQNIVFEIPDDERQTIFSEDFDDGAGDWPLDSDDDVKLKVDDGVYVIDRTKQEGNYIILHSGFDFSEDFTIEARMRKTKGDDDSVWYGLVWGYETNSDYSDFLVGADGTYSLDQSRQGEYTEVVGWTTNEALEEKSGWNTLRLERRAPASTIMGSRIRFMHDYQYHFYLNGQLVASYDDWPAYFGEHLGLRMSGDVKVEVDYVKVTRP